ncbi:hypothetical protein ST201phi2-1p147 [Pseudomonas phage 201phi2-1]|uniref:Uncharacterized protein n=1 Tax=Pseudomonas phage 201phi2-1 TaxID=198110 RepID=B3FJ10_BP201|nr:hypothetical protein ST201phi2-1p147 [Pseudomonas phage 201phi2-1]ABY62977.1 hypothetical protein 201phi2-1p147 [Pseudomonas phage 201phi2-1]
MSDYAKIVYPRITKGYAKSLIAEEQIVVNAEMCVVICMVRLNNGHRLVTDAIVANSGLFDAARGTQIARDKMISKIMELEMYQMRTRLHDERTKEVTDVD